MLEVQRHRCHVRTLCCLPVEGSGQTYGQFWLPDAHLVPSAAVLGEITRGRRGNDCVNDLARSPSPPPNLMYMLEEQKMGRESP